RSAGSWRQALDGPAAVGFSPIADAVVEAVRGALPELDRSGNDAEAAPFGRPRHPVVTVTDRELLDARLERFATRDRLALGRCDGAETARDRSRIEVSVRLLGRHALGPAFDPHLAVERVP